MKKESEEVEKNIVRIGRISSINKVEGTARVVYTDKNSTTSEFPLFNFSKEYKVPEIGELVVVLHLSNDSSTGIILGTFWNMENKPETEAEYQKTFKKGKAYEKYQEPKYTLRAENIMFECETGQISVKELIEMKRKLENLEKEGIT